MDREQPLAHLHTFEEDLSSLAAQPRFTMVIFTVFAALGLALAMAGIYSVLSYVVSRRTREIGVRMALGAQRADVLRLIFRTGGSLAGLGMLVGLLASLAGARLLANLDNASRITTADALPLLGVFALIALAASLACLLPARRAAKVDPMVALRYE